MDTPEIPIQPPFIENASPPPPPRPIRIVRDGILSFIVAISVTLILVVAMMVAAMISGSMPLGSAGISIQPEMMAPLLFATELPFAGVGFFLLWLYRRSGRFIPSVRAPKVPAIMKGIVAGVAMSIFGFLHAALATTLFGRASTESMEELMKSLLSLKGNPVTVGTLVFAIAVLAPLCEEFFFRGALFSSVRLTPKARAGAVVSSILFAVAHLNPMMFTYYVIFALTMCWLLNKTGTLASSIAAHMTVNFVACVAVLLGGSID